MRLLTLDEYQTRYYEQPLPLEVARALHATGLVTVARHLDGRLQLTALSKVGVVRIGSGAQGTEVRVRPKLPISRLLWLISHAHGTSGWRDDPVAQREHDGLIPAIAVSFAALASRALRHGTLRGYQEVNETASTLRGRLRIGDQLRHHGGLPAPLEVTYDDHTTDIGENQILLAAARRLHRVPGIPTATRGALTAIIGQLTGVTGIAPTAPLPTTPPTRLNQRYQPALRLARIALAGRSVEHPPGDVEATGYIFDLNLVFEKWLLGALRSEIEGRYGGTVAHNHVLHLDDDNHIPMKTDITWWDGGTCLAVIDAKYKRRPDNANFYQMLAYTTAAHLPTGHLIYAAGDIRRHYSIRKAGKTITTHVLQLDGSTEAIREQISELAAAIEDRSGTIPNLTGQYA